MDGVAPELTVNFVGREIDNELYFNKELPFVPRLKVPETLSRWDISVFDKKNELVLLHEGTGQIPPRIIWNGMLSGTEAAPDDRYRVLVQAWDRAENLATFEGFVNLMNTKPRVKVTVERAESDVHVQMENEVASPLAFWFAKVYEKNGGMVKGTLFADTAGTIKINEVGAYGQVSQEMLNDVLKLTVSGRYDKNTNFAGRFTPRATAVVKLAKDHNLRFSYQTAYRFPTTQDSGSTCW